jgi:4-hydroxybenzoate polyprenyltransferase
MQLIFRYGFETTKCTFMAITVRIISIIIVLLAAAGYVINDIFDQDTDIENKPKEIIVGKSITEAKAYNIYLALNTTGCNRFLFSVECHLKSWFCRHFYTNCGYTFIFLQVTSLKQNATAI